MQEYHFKNADFFYSPLQYFSGNSITLEGDEFNHLIKVMRKNIDDIIYVVDGLGYIYESRINEIGKKALTAEIISKTKSVNEPAIDLTLALGLLKNPSKYDFVVEKATELGVKHIVPFISKYTIAQKPKIERWQNLAVSAMKQSQRAWLPSISECLSFDELIKLQADVKLIADIDAVEITQLSFEPSSSILVLIGPEGGFSDEEIQKAIKAGFSKVKLSQMRLRAETAAIVSIPLITSRLSK